MGAVQAVFDINELLEMILVQLPMREILIAREVCTHWNKLIWGSATLKRVTFRMLNGSECLSIAPLQDQVNHCVALSSKNYISCPIFRQYTHLASTTPLGAKAPTWRRIEYKAFSISNKFLLEVECSPNVSSFYSSMNFTYPPCKAVSLRMIENEMPEGFTRLSLKDGNGVTIGLAAKMVKRMLDQARELVTPGQFERLLSRRAIVYFSTLPD